MQILALPLLRVTAGKRFSLSAAAPSLMGEEASGLHRKA